MPESHDFCQSAGPIDERLALPLEQCVLLWCMRSLVIEMRRGIAAQAQVEDMLTAFGCSRAAPMLRRFLLALSENCTRLIEVRCVCQKRLTPDERILLDVVGLAQAMRPFEALLALRTFVTQSGAVDALRHAEQVGAVLAQAGRFLPEPEEEVRHFAMTRSGPLWPNTGTCH